MKELVQQLLNTTVEKRVFASFSEFKKTDTQQFSINISKLKEGLDKDVTYQSVISSKADPKELRIMLEKAFDAAQSKLKENVFTAFDAVFPNK